MKRLGDRFQFRRLSSFEMHEYSTEKVAVLYYDCSDRDLRNHLYAMHHCAIENRRFHPDDRGLVGPNESIINLRRLGRRDGGAEIARYQHLLVAILYFFF